MIFLNIFSPFTKIFHNSSLSPPDSLAPSPPLFGGEGGGEGANVKILKAIFDMQFLGALCIINVQFLETLLRFFARNFICFYLR